MRPEPGQLPKAVKCAVALTLLLIVGAISPRPSHASAYDRFLEHFDGLLASYVQPTEFRGIRYNGVDYDGWAKDSRHNAAREALFDSDPGMLMDHDGRLAYWINAYNFLTIELVIREEERESIRNLGTWFRTPWETHTWMVGDRMRTLDDIEHGIIRPMGDPRIHFAVNCAALSCPNLRPEAYRAESLNQQLDDQVRLTLNDPTKGFRVESSRDQVMVSKVFQWFGEDFEGGDLRGWLQDYKPMPLGPDTHISFLRYDWGLNDIMEPGS